MIEKFLPVIRSKWLYTFSKKFQQLPDGPSKYSPFDPTEQARREALYHEREQRVMDVWTQRKIPDRVPVISGAINFFAPKYAGITCQDFMFNFDKALASTINVFEEFPFDMGWPVYAISFGKIMQALDFNLLKLPGLQLDPNVTYQFDEYPRLKQDEYSEFLTKGIKFFTTTLVPRFAGLLAKKGWAKFHGEMQAGLIGYKYLNQLVRAHMLMRDHGYYIPSRAYSFSAADIFIFGMRGMTEFVKDIYDPTASNQLLELLDRATPWLSHIWALEAATSEAVVLFIERAFSLSKKLFAKFYWPFAKRLILDYVAQGKYVMLLFENDDTHLAEFLLELPKEVAQKCLFVCDSSDLFEVDKKLDGYILIAGNVPPSLFCVGTPNQIENYCEKLFDHFKEGAHFMLGPSLGIPDEAKPENVHAFIDYAQKYGQYS